MPLSILKPEGTSAAIEWISVKAATEQTSFSRSFIYELIADGSIKSASIRKKGNIRGRRLISVESLNAFIESQSEGGATAQK